MLIERDGAVAIWWQRVPDEKRGDRAGIRLLKVWLNHVGIVALIEAQEIDDDTQRRLAALLRVVSDAARQVRRSGPLLGIVVPQNSEDSLALREKVSRLAFNQEWHRGDFVLRYAQTYDEAQSFMQMVLQPFLDVRPPIAMDQAEQVYFHALNERLGTEGMSALTKALLETVIAGENDARRAIDAFREEALGSITEAVKAAKAEQKNQEDEDGE